MNLDTDNLKVGDIVICHGWDVTENKKGFVEEIVTEPQKRFTGRRYTGKFSIYGLEYAQFTTDKSLYFGDYLGEDLEPTGDFMTKEDLTKYKQQEPNNKGLQKDIDFVISNLGKKTQGERRLKYE